MPLFVNCVNTSLYLNWTTHSLYPLNGGNINANNSHVFYSLTSGSTTHLKYPLSTSKCCSYLSSIAQHFIFSTYLIAHPHRSGSDTTYHLVNFPSTSSSLLAKKKQPSPRQSPSGPPVSLQLCAGSTISTACFSRVVPVTAPTFSLTSSSVLVAEKEAGPINLRISPIRSVRDTKVVENHQSVRSGSNGFRSR